MRRFDLALPRNLDDVCEDPRRARADAELVAGGTDLLPQMKNGLIKPACVVDLSGVAAAAPPRGDRHRAPRRRRGDGAGPRAGPRVRGAIPSLAESAALVGSVQVRNLATVGGNICNAAPSADMAPPLWPSRPRPSSPDRGASAACRWRIFFLGVRRTVLAPDEVLVELVVPAPGAASGGNYLRHTPRRELDIAVVGVASQLTLDGACAKARIALAAVAPTPRSGHRGGAGAGRPGRDPRADRAGGGAGRRRRATHQRPARLGGLPPSSGSRPDRRTLTTALARAGPISGGSDPWRNRL